MPARSDLIAALLRESQNLSTRGILFHAAVADRLGLHPTDHKCLDFIASTPGITAGKLAEFTGLTTGAITGVLDRLEAGRFVKRVRDPDDKRRVLVRVLPERLGEVHALFRSLGTAFQKSLASYSIKELQLLLENNLRSQRMMLEETEKLMRLRKRR